MVRTLALLALVSASFSAALEPAPARPLAAASCEPIDVQRVAEFEHRSVAADQVGSTVAVFSIAPAELGRPPIGRVRFLDAEGRQLRDRIDTEMPLGIEPEATGDFDLAVSPDRIAIFFRQRADGRAAVNRTIFRLFDRATRQQITEIVREEPPAGDLFTKDVRLLFDDDRFVAARGERPIGSDGAIEILQIDQNGELIGRSAVEVEGCGRARITETLDSGIPTILWEGGCPFERRAFFTELRRDGVVATRGVERVFPAPFPISYRADVQSVSTPGGYAIVATGLGPLDGIVVYMQEFSRDGAPRPRRSPSLVVTNFAASAPGLIWNDDGYISTWTRGLSSSSDLVVQQIAPGGEIVDQLIAPGLGELDVPLFPRLGEFQPVPAYNALFRIGDRIIGVHRLQMIAIDCE